MITQTYHICLYQHALCHGEKKKKRMVCETKLLSIYMANAYEDTEILTMFSFVRHILVGHFVENELATLANGLQD